MIRLVAVLASVAIVLGFGLFVQEQGAAATERQIQRVEGPAAPVPEIADERQRERLHGGVREVIDDVNDLLFTPFAALVEGRDLWAQRLITLVLGLLLYGVVPSFAANYVRK